MYVMRSILHDWDDASSIKILRALSAVMKGGNAKLVLVEQVATLLLWMAQHEWADMNRCYQACGCWCLQTATVCSPGVWAH